MAFRASSPNLTLMRSSKSRGAHSRRNGRGWALLRPLLCTHGAGAVVPAFGRANLAPRRLGRPRRTACCGAAARGPASRSCAALSGSCAALVGACGGCCVEADEGVRRRRGALSRGLRHVPRSALRRLRRDRSSLVLRRERQGAAQLERSLTLTLTLALALILALAVTLTLTLPLTRYRSAGARSVRAPTCLRG